MSLGEGRWEVVGDFAPIIAILLLLMVTFGFWYTVIGRTKRNAEDQLVSTNENLFAIWSYDGVIMYENIIEATEEFDSKYCIGSGAYRSVYKARLSTDQIVAVKKFHILPDRDIVGTTGGSLENLLSDNETVAEFGWLERRNVARAWQMHCATCTMTVLCL
ncbi:hypothetical protein CDL15_Pgr016374 [Punica granatum]|uniref:non-specific serine/threonine protein kinase n=1 Tax=Punica granatum TaxID=22663 RepID=A0A218W5M1_PUNGR|nr:hypothetical protein CDL15_Pgr016374 [Punica granatum]